MMASCSPVSTQTATKKTLPKEISELVDVAIFTFSCQTGLRSCHKVRGNPVLEGVSAFFGQLLRTSSQEIQEAMRSISPVRFGGWQPGEAPTPQILTFLSSRMKTLKSKEELREDTNLAAPSVLVERKQKFVEEEDRVVTRTFPRCWRCRKRCRFCLKSRSEFPNFGNLRTDMASPFLDVLEKMMDEDDANDSNDDGSSSDAAEFSDDSEAYRNLLQCSDNVFLDDEDEQDLRNEDSRDSNEDN